MTIGTTGYWIIGHKQYSFLDCFYMTFITVATIGYGEVIDLSRSPAGRIFTMFIALSGIEVLTYCLSMFTALVVEGELRETFKRKNGKDH
jgi:voltage-gated potassium channel